MTTTRAPWPLSDCCAALADVAVAADDRDLAAEHDVGAAVDAVDERVADAVQVVELGLGDRVVHVDRRERAACLLRASAESRLHAGRGLLGDAADAGGDALPEARSPRRTSAKPLHEDALFFAGVVGGRGHGTGLFELEALVHEHRGVATVVEDQVRAAAVGPVEQLLGRPPVLLERLALPGEHREHRRVIDGAVGANRNRSSRVILGREDVAGHPTNVSAESGERLDQHCGLDGHVQRADDAGAGERLLVGVLGTQRHQAGHLVLGEADLLAAEFGQGEIGDAKVLLGGVSHSDVLCSGSSKEVHAIGSLPWLVTPAGVV